MRFLTKATTRTAVKVPRTVTFELGGVDVRATISNWDVEREGGRATHYGLFMDIEQDADSPDESLNLGVMAADHVITLVAFAASAGVSPLQPVALIDAEPGTRDRFVRQYLELPSELLPTRQLDEEVFAALWSAFDQAPGRSEARLARALHWIRKDLLDEYDIDKFIDGWSALEVLNPLIKQKHRLPATETKRACPNCGEPVITAATNAGVKRMIVAASEESAWKEVNDRRQKILHGHAPIADVVDGIDRDIRASLDGARGGLLDLLDIKDMWPRFRRTPVKVPDFARLRLEWELVAADRSEIPFGPDYPQLALRSSEQEQQPVEGRTRERVRIEWGPANFEGGWRPLAAEVEADSDPDDYGGTIEIA